LLASGWAFADSITTSFSCSITGATTVTGSTPCFVPGDNGGAASAGFVGGPPDLPLSFGPTTSFSESASVIVDASGGPFSFGSPNENDTFASASASVDSEITAISSGPPREGLVALFLAANTTNLFGIASATLQVGPYETASAIINTQPFELGVPFQISLSVSAQGEGFPIVGPGDASVGAIVSFSLFESDGVTPVSFSSTPEPSTIALCLTGLAALVLASLTGAATVRKRVNAKMPTCRPQT
jgi:hypothetical protein